jgi:hypothetical protein
MVSFHSYVAVYQRVSIGVPTLPVVLHRCHVRWLRPIRGRSAWTGAVSERIRGGWGWKRCRDPRIIGLVTGYRKAWVFIMFYHEIIMMIMMMVSQKKDDVELKEWASSLSARRMLHSWRKCPASLHAKTFGHLHGCTSRDRSCYHFVGSFLHHVLEVSLWTVLGLPCPLFAIVLRSCALSGDGGRPSMGGHIPDVSRFLDSRWCQLMSWLKNGWAKGHWPIIMLPLWDPPNSQSHSTTSWRTRLINYATHSAMPSMPSRNAKFFPTFPTARLAMRDWSV